MSPLRVSPAPPLDAFVAQMWCGSGAGAWRGREWALPDAAVSLVFNLSGDALRWHADADDLAGHTVPGAVVHGPQSRPYVLGERRGMATLGVCFRPGAAGALLGVPAAELADRHVSLESLWGRRAVLLRERLQAAATAPQRIAILQRALLDGLRRPLLLQPAIAEALCRVDAAPSMAVDRVRAASGYGATRFNALFTEAVGLRPKLYMRLRRFETLLTRARAEPQTDWAALAAEAGYADQPHLHRDFHQFAGLTPAVWRRVPSRHVLHRPVDAGASS